MNRHHLLQKAFRHQYRMYAFRISLIAHVILVLAFSFFFIKSQVIEPEDEIHVELIEALPRQKIVKQKVIEIETPIKQVEVPTHKKLPVEKPVDLMKPEASLATAKMLPELPTAVDIQQPPAAKIDVDVPIALSTDADLPTAPASVVSVRQSTAAADVENRYIGHQGPHTKNPRKGAGAGTRKWTKETGAGQEIDDGVAEIGAGQGQGIFDTGAEQPTFRSIIKELTEDIIDSSGEGDGAPVDVVFVVDASGSMGDNINAVAEHLGVMVDAYKASEIDYQLGLTHFSINEKNQNRIHVFQLTQDLSKYKAALSEIQLGGDEHALDAINETLMKLRFRSNAIKHLILVTDEPFTSLHGFTVDDAINLCRKNKVYVNVLGIDKPKHKYLAAVTGGTWHTIPVNVNKQ